MAGLSSAMFCTPSHRAACTIQIKTSVFRKNAVVLRRRKTDEGGVIMRQRTSLLECGGKSRSAGDDPAFGCGTAILGQTAFVRKAMLSLTLCRRRRWNGTACGRRMAPGSADGTFECAGMTALWNSMTCHRVQKQRLVAKFQNGGAMNAANASSPVGKRRGIVSSRENYKHANIKNSLHAVYV